MKQLYTFLFSWLYCILVCILIRAFMEKRMTIHKGAEELAREITAKLDDEHDLSTEWVAAKISALLDVEREKIKAAIDKLLAELKAL